VARILVAVLALAAAALAVERITAPMRALEIRELRAGSTPVTLFARPDAGLGPAVVIAHGFAGSRPLMHPFAVTLAQAGYRALVFDFPGHGRHPQPLRGPIADESGATAVLVGVTLDVLRLARSLPGSGGTTALLGHSMASDIVVRAAQRDGGVAATVAVSMFSPAVTASSPRNLLVIVGAWEPEMLRAEGRRALAQVAGDEPPQAGQIYGDFDDGSARQLVLVDGVEHIGVLYARDSLRAARDWLNRVFGREGAGAVDRRGPWLALLIAALVVLVWPLSALLPRAAARRVGAGLRWRALWPVIVAPAVATPLVLRVVPTDFLPVLVGDYLAAHFALYGVLSALALWCVRVRGTQAPPTAAVRRVAVLAGGAALAAYAVLVLGGALDRWFTSFWPIPERLPLGLAMLGGTLPFFLAVEWSTRGEAAARGGHAAAKVAFLASLGLAVALDPGGLLFVVFILPAIVVFFLVFGLFAHWAYARTGHPAPGAIGNAVALAVALAVTFPTLDA